MSITGKLKLKRDRASLEDCERKDGNQDRKRCTVPLERVDPFGVDDHPLDLG